MTVGYDDILAASRRIAGQVERTPFRRSRTLSEITGADVWVKFENLQFTGSFKDRGALNKLLLMSEDERRRGVVAASAGNHAQALAWHAGRLGVPATIVMPRATPIVKREQTKGFGAEVLMEGETYDDAWACATRLAEERNLVLVSAFNDLHIIAGQGTCAVEMLEEVPDLEALVVPIGGAGLIAGMAIAAKAMKPDIRIWGVEAAMYPSYTALMRGEPPKCGGATIAEGIAVKEVGDLTWAIARPLVEDTVLVEEAKLEEAVSLYCNVEKVVAEGAGAAALAALLTRPEPFAGRKTGIVLSGGNIDSRLLASVLNRELVREHRLVHIRLIGDDRPGMLAGMASVIGGIGGNIVDVVHNRLALDVPAKGAEFDILVETRDAQHSEEIKQALRDKGYRSH